jgi:archaellum biogenesis protein FlaJ (TadC family)
MLHYTMYSLIITGFFINFIGIMIISLNKPDKSMSYHEYKRLWERQQGGQQLCMFGLLSLILALIIYLLLTFVMDTPIQ